MAASITLDVWIYRHVWIYRRVWAYWFVNSVEGVRARVLSVMGERAGCGFQGRLAGGRCGAVSGAAVVSSSAILF